MLERLIDYYLAEPGRLTSLGTALARVGAFLLVAGLVGEVATTAASAVKGLAGAHHLHVTVGDVLPGYLSVWMPEGIFGFGMALLILTTGLWATRAGRIYEREVGASPAP